MTDFPDVKVKALVSFPANVIGGTGIEVNKVNGHYNIDLDFSEFEPPGRVTDYDNQHVLLWDAIANAYLIVPARSVCAGGAVPEADDDGVLYGRKNLAWEPITVGEGNTPSNTDPVMDGIATEGVLATYSRGDHVHPSDTSRVAKAGDTMTGPLILHADAPTSGNDREAVSKAYVDTHAGGTGIGTFLPKLYISGMEPALIGGTTIRIGRGVCANEDGTELLQSLVDLDIDITTNFGNLKLDKGTRQNGMGYSVFIIRKISDGSMGAVLSTCRFSQTSSDPPAQTFTVSIASPAVFTKTAHGIADKAIVVLSTTGVLPTGIQIDEAYFVNVTSTSTFQLSKTLEGPAINTSGTQSGTHTVTCEYVRIPDGYEFWRKLPLGLMYNTTATAAPMATGFLAFHVSHWPMPHFRLTQSNEMPAWAVLSAGSATAWTAIHPSAFVPYDARLIHIRCVVKSAGGSTPAGTAFVATAGTGSVDPNGFTVGRVTLAADVVSTYHTLAVTSTGRISYKITGGARLYIYILGYDWTQNS